MVKTLKRRFSLPKSIELVVDLVRSLNEDPVPNLRKLAAKHGIPYTTAWRIVEGVRYKNWGVIQAVPSYKRLGLKLLALVARLEHDKWTEAAEKFLYLQYAAEMYGNGGRSVLLVFNSPPEMLDDHVEAVERQIGSVAERIELDSAVPSLPDIRLMDPETHEIKLEKLRVEVPEGLAIGREEVREKFDRLDVDLLARLQEQGFRRVSELAREVKINRKVVEYRLRRRVKPLIEGFQLKLLWDRELPNSLFIITGDEAFKAAAFSRVPKSVEVFVGENVALVQIPLKPFERLQAIKVLSAVGEWREYLIDPKTAIRRTVPVEAYDEESKEWIKKVLKE